MNNKILKRIFTVLIIIVLVFNIDNLKADESRYLENSNGVVCIPTEIGPIPVIWSGWEWTDSNKKYKADPTKLVSGLNRSFHCLAARHEKWSGAGGPTAKQSYYAIVNPTWRVYFPIIQNAISDLNFESSAFKDKKIYIDLTDHMTVDDGGTGDYDISPDIKAIKESISSIMNNAEFSNLKNSAKKTCEKYCNKCHYTEGNYSYYCNDYNLKTGIHVISPSTYTGHNLIPINFANSFTTGWNAIFNGWSETEEKVSSAGWIRTIDTCSNVNCMGKIVSVSEEYKLPTSKNCYNYVEKKSRGYSFPENASSVNDIDGWRYWLCESKADCEASCFGTCVSPNEYSKENKTSLNSIDKDVKSYMCLGTKIRNSRFENGDSTEDFKYYTNNYDNLKSMLKYDGDGIKASLSNIYAVGTGKITCEGVFGKDGKGQLGKILREVFKYMRIAAVALFVIFTTLDFIKAISGADDSPIKSATKNLTKRFVILLVLLILPTLLNIVLSIIEIKNGLCFLN